VCLGSNGCVSPISPLFNRLYLPFRYTSRCFWVTPSKSTSTLVHPCPPLSALVYRTDKFVRVMCTVGRIIQERRPDPEPETKSRTQPPRYQHVTFELFSVLLLGWVGEWCAYFVSLFGRIPEPFQPVRCRKCRENVSPNVCFFSWGLAGRMTASIPLPFFPTIYHVVTSPTLVR
jgi:hypothetical protein